MANLEEIVVQLTAETSQLRAQMATAAKVTEDAASKMEKAIEQFSKDSAKNTGFFQTAMATMTGFLGSQAVLGVVEHVKDAFKEMGAAIADGVQDANAEEDAIKRLSTALALQGKFSTTAIEGLRGYAGEMEALTGVQDHVIAGNLALLASLTKLNSDGLKKAETAALDMSSALGIDLDTATRLVAKGIEGNVSAFQRYGITIQQGRNETENFANVVGKLNERFGGAAKGNLETFSGAVLNLKNAFGNAFEVIGRVITNNEALKTVISQLAGLFKQLEEYVTQNADALSKGLSSAIEGTITGLAVVFDVIGKVVGSLKLMYNGIMVVIDGIVALVNAAIAIQNFDMTGAEKAFDGVGKRIEAVNDIIEGRTTNVFIQARDKVLEFGEGVAEAGDKQASAFNKATPAVKNHAAAIDDLVNKFYNMRQAAQDSEDSFVKGLLDQAVAFDSMSTNMQDTNQAQYEADLISFNDYQANKLAIMQQSIQNQSDALARDRANGVLTETQYQAAISQLAINQANTQLKVTSDLNKQRAENMKSTLGTIATLQSSSSKELAAIGKAAAITTATIDGYAAVQKALASAPPPFNFALAAIVGVAAAANVAKIAGVGLAKGIDEVPGIGTQDNFPAVLAPGERVVPAKSNEDLNEFLQSQKGESSKQPIIINMNFNGIGAITREQASNIVEAINDTLASNASLRILST